MGDIVDPKEMHRVVVTCVVYDPQSHRYLILHRRDDVKEYPGKWQVPGGGLTQDDYASRPAVNGGWPGVLEIAVCREVREEAGVEITDIEYLGNVAFVRNDGVFVIAVKFMAALLSPSEAVRVDPSDSTECQWITAAEVGDYDFLGEVTEDIRRVDILQH